MPRLELDCFFRVLGEELADKRIIHVASLKSQLNKQLGSDADGSQSANSGQITPSWDNEYDVDHLQGVADLEDWNNAAVDSFLSGHSPSATSTLGQAAAAPGAAPLPSSPNWLSWTVDSRRFEDPMLGSMDLPKALPPQLLSPADTASLTAASCSDRPTSLIECDEQQPVTSPTGTSMFPPLMTEYERADLDQVFFDRVHPVLPLFYRRRCHGWINQPLPGSARACLRSAMRTIAAAMSAPAARFCDQLYAETRRLLEAYTATSKEDIELGYIQAWLLLGFYELLRVGENQATLTAARCSRLVLMARLFEIDAALGCSDEEESPHDEEDSSHVVEERRRTFWLAFCLDCFLYSRNEYPPTMQAEMVSVKVTELTICS